jgi:tetratricopeptide (TPR) repeat protein
VLVNLGDALRLRGEWRAEGFADDYEEAIALHREAGEDLNGGIGCLGRVEATRYQWMGIGFYSRFEKMGGARDLDEAIPLLRKALGLYHPTDVYRSKAITFLIKSVQALHSRDGSLSHLEEAIALTRELLSKHYILGHWRRGEWVDRLLSLLQKRVDATGDQDDLDEIVKLKEGSKD